MPFVNGAGFLFRLREDPANQSIPVAVITGMPTMADAALQDLRALGAEVHYKPLSIDEIAEIARTLLARTA